MLEGQREVPFQLHRLAIQQVRELHHLLGADEGRALPVRLSPSYLVQSWSGRNRVGGPEGRARQLWHDDAGDLEYDVRAELHPGADRKGELPSSGRGHGNLEDSSLAAYLDGGWQRT